MSTIVSVFACIFMPKCQVFPLLPLAISRVRFPPFFFVELGASTKLASTIRLLQIVIEHNIVTGLEQQDGGMRTDETHAAGEKDFHFKNPSNSVWSRIVHLKGYQFKACFGKSLTPKSLRSVHSSSWDKYSAPSKHRYAPIKCFIR